jgi:hypothetical protein
MAWGWPPEVRKGFGFPMGFFNLFEAMPRNGGIALSSFHSRYRKARGLPHIKRQAGKFWEALPVATRRTSSRQLADIGKKSVDREPTGWQRVILKYV